MGKNARNLRLKHCGKKRDRGTVRKNDRKGRMSQKSANPHLWKRRKVGNGPIMSNQIAGRTNTNESKEGGGEGFFSISRHTTNAIGTPSESSGG